MRNIKDISIINTPNPNQIFDKNVLEEEITTLSYALYKLLKALNAKEDMLHESNDLEIQAIIMEDYSIIAKDFLDIVEQVKIRITLYREMSDKLNIPVEIDYVRLYKQLEGFQQHNKGYDNC